MEELKRLLEQFSPENYDWDPEWFCRGWVDDPAKELAEKDFDLQSVITASHSADGSGIFLGYRYYKDVEQALVSETLMSFTGISHIWLDPEADCLDTSMLPVVCEQAEKLASFIESAKISQRLECFGIGEILEGFQERHFKIFSTLEEFASSWGRSEWSAIGRRKDVLDEYKRHFGNSFNYIDLRNIDEFVWVLHKLPCSDVGV
jgi:hypothetical protein